MSDHGSAAEPPPPATRQFAAYEVITIGCLMTGLAGLCTTIVVVIGLPALLSGGGVSIGSVLSAAMLPRFIGGTPIGAGVVMILIGRHMLRSGQRGGPPRP